MLSRSEVAGMTLDDEEMHAVISGNKASSPGGWVMVGFEEAKRQMLAHFPAAEPEVTEAEEETPGLIDRIFPGS